MKVQSTLARWGGRLGLLAVLTLTAACSTPPPAAPTAAPTEAPTTAPVEAPTEAPAEAPTEVPPTEAPAGDEAGIRPATEACSSLEPAVFKALGVEVTVAEAPFKDPLSDETGVCCELSAQDTGIYFESLDVVMEALDLVLTSHGWQPDEKYVADGPTGTARGYRLDDQLCIATVQWEPTADADCPDDVPIADCDLEPEQMLYTVSLQIVQKD